MKLNINRRLLLILITIFTGCTMAFAGPTKQELKPRFEKRYPEIQKYKAEGKIGETSAGFVEAVKDADAALSKLIDAENADRRALYEIIAKEENVPVEVVAQRAAQRNFERARPGEYLKHNGVWRQK